MTKINDAVTKHLQYIGDGNSYYPYMTNTHIVTDDENEANIRLNTGNWKLISSSAYKKLTEPDEVLESDITTPVVAKEKGVTNG